MLRLKKARIKNARVYKDIEVDLEKQGIVSVKGKNGAGKSTLFNLIESTFFGSMPNGDKKNQLVKGKGNSSIIIECEKNGDEYVLEQKRVSGRWKYEITKNGKDDTPHAQKDQLSKIESILELNQKEFQGSVHLTQNGNHILIKGKPQERKEYISDFFNLDGRFEEVKEEAKEERRKVGKEIERLNALSQTRDTLREDFDEMSLMDESKLQSDLEKAKEAKEKLLSKKDDLKTSKEVAKKYEELLPLATSVENPEGELENCENRLAEIKATISQSELIEEYNVKARKNNLDLQTNMGQIKALKATIPEDWANLGYEYLVDFQNKLQIKKDSADKIKPLSDELNALKDVEEIDVTELEKDLEESRLELEQTKNLRTSGLEVERVKKELEEIPTYDVDLSVSFQDKIEALNNDIYSLNTKKDAYLKVKHLLEELDTYPIVTEIDLTQAEEDLRNIQNQKDFLQKKVDAISSGQCPTCGAQHSSENIQEDLNLLEQYRKSEQEFIAYISKVKEDNKVAQRRGQIISIVQGVESFSESDEENLKSLNNQLAELKEKSSLIEQAKQAQQKRTLLQSQIEGKLGWSGEDEYHLENSIADFKKLEQKINDTKKDNAIAQRRKVILAQIEGKELLTETEIQQYEALGTIVPNMKKLGDLERLIEGKDFEKVKDNIDVSDLTLEQTSINNKITELKTVIKAKENLPEKPEKTFSEYEQELEDLESKLSRVEEIFIKINQDIAVVDQNNTRYKKLKKQIEDMEEDLTKMPELKRHEYFWKVMEDAYGPKGLRVKHLDNIMNLIMGRLPIYTNYLFEEDMEFFHKCDSGQIEIFVRRKDDKGEVFEYDISSMSGGETKKLSIAFMLALSDAVPKRKRCNILILDEIDSPLDADSRYMFINELLPTLIKDYESIFVVSHSTESAQANVFDKTWTIENQPDQWTTITVD